MVIKVPIVILRWKRIKIGFIFHPVKGGGLKGIKNQKKSKSRQPSKRNLEIIELAKTDITLSEIGLKFGVTRERVRQILNKYGEKSYRAKNKHLIKSQCKNCGELFILNKNSSASFCSPECRSAYGWLDLTCDFCGEKFRRSRTLIKTHTKERGYKTGKHFCSQSCFAKYQWKIGAWHSRGKRGKLAEAK